MITKCPKCDADVFADGATNTLLSYSQRVDKETGRPHDHNPNCRIQYYHCANGHRISERVIRECWCGWRQNETCFCHPAEPKVA